MHSYRWWSVFSKASLLALAFVITSPASAVVNVDRTRLIFSENDVAQSLNLSNDGTTPRVIQVWADNGDPHSSPDVNPTPIVAIPPVFKIQPGELRSLKLMLSSRQALPTDRESQYWLNIYQIAPNDADSQNKEPKVQLPLRLRMKIFIRPAGLKAPHEEDEQKLQFTQAGDHLRIRNPTPWFMSLSLHIGGQPKPISVMVSPLGTFEMPWSPSMNPGEKLRYDVITDDGNYRSYQAALSTEKP
jgi:P pilus assembly protein, chaperone PapD